MSLSSLLSQLHSRLQHLIYLPSLPSQYTTYLSLTSPTPPSSISKDQYDTLHTMHISNHTGATYIHLTLLTSLLFLLTLYLTITLKNACFQRKKPLPLSLSHSLLFLAEFATKVFIFILVVFQKIQGHLSLLMLNIFLLGLITLLYVHKARHHQFQWFSRRKIVLLENQSQKSFISEFRSQMMIMTCICILAVDFRDYISGYFKTEEWGIGLMDTGVSMFIFSSGLVSLAARRDQHASLQREKGSKREGANAGSASNEASVQSPGAVPAGKRQFSSQLHRRHLPHLSWGFIIKVLRHASPLLLLGFIRFATVWAADYQAHAHVSEYGVHWNFFFTLAFISIFVNITDVFMVHSNALHYLCLAVLAALTQQTLLMYGMEKYIFEAPRTNLFSANKEGICSLLGYLSIHYFAVAIGRLIFSSSTVAQVKESEHRGTYHIFKARWKFVAKVIFGSTLLLWAYHALSAPPATVGGPALFQRFLHKINLAEKFIHNENTLRSLTVPSRRLLNLPYILWSVTLALSTLGATLFFDLSIDRMTRQNLLRDAINRNSLILFLFANVLTGTINLLVKTLLVRDFVGLLIVTGYMLLVCMFAVFLHEKRITIRL